MRTLNPKRVLLGLLLVTNYLSGGVSGCSWFRSPPVNCLCQCTLLSACTEWVQPSEVVSGEAWVPSHLWCRRSDTFPWSDSVGDCEQCTVGHCLAKSAQHFGISGYVSCVSHCGLTQPETADLMSEPFYNTNVGSSTIVADEAVEHNYQDRMAPEPDYYEDSFDEVLPPS